MPNIIIEDTDGNPYNYTISGYCTGQELYNAALKVTGLGQAKNGCDGLTTGGIILLSQGREIPNDSTIVYGLQERSRIFVVFRLIGGSNDVKELKEKINFRICSCGSRAINSTMYSKQQCLNGSCRRWVCFFCNRDWNDSTMRNQQYTCGLTDCNYQMKLNFQLVPMVPSASGGLLIPNTRFCPNCFHYGGYGNACKYHTCGKCQLEFCYFCLKSKANCQAAYKNVDCYHQCASPPVKQSYSDIPRIN